MSSIKSKQIVPPAGGKPAVWLVLPTYNEALNLERLVTAVLNAYPSLHVLIVDDNSPDGTGEIADRMAAENDSILVLHRHTDKGLGRAYTEGINLVLKWGASVVIQMDCDFSHDPNTLPKLIAAVESADLVIGSRYVPGGKTVNWPVRRRVLSFCANQFVRLLFRLPTQDCTSGFRVWRAEKLRQIPWDQLHSTGYSFLVECLYWATRDPKTRVQEVPITFTERELGTSKMGGREAARGAVDLLRSRRTVTKRMRDIRREQLEGNVV